MKTCPHCAEQIQNAARVCPHCRSKLGVSNGQIGCIALLALLCGFCVLGKANRNEDTANLIMDSKRACEAQTGGPC